MPHSQLYFLIQIKQKDRKNNTDTLYEVVCLESESERERRKTTASPSIRLPQSGSQSSMIPSPPEDEEEEGKKLVLYSLFYLHALKEMEARLGN